MNGKTGLGTRRTALALGALAGALITISLGSGLAAAAPGITATVQGGTLTVQGTSADEIFVLRLEAGSATTLQVDVGGDGTADFSFDRDTFTAVVVDAAGGNDQIRVDQGGGPFTDELVTMDGGGGADTLLGGSGADVLLGGGGDDLVDGNQGADLALLGSGDDRFQWDPGDGSDTVEGGKGTDLLDFFGSNIGENIDVSANGKRVRLTRNVGAITIDLNGVEGIAVHALGGADLLTVNDLTGTDAKTVDADLAATGGVGDAQPDTVIVNGTDKRDRVDVTRSGSEVIVAGLAAAARITGSEPLLDTLRIQTLAGDDVVTVAPDVADLIATVVDLGPDD